MTSLQVTEAAARPGLTSRPNPGRVLVLIDALAVAIAMLLVGGILAVLGDSPVDRQHLLAPLAVLAAATPTFIGLKLYVRAANRIASTEMTRLARASAILAGVVLGTYAVLGLPGGLTPALLVGATLFVTTSVGRQVFRDYLRAQRRSGAMGYRTVVVGNGDAATELIGMLHDHPDLGFEPVGVLSTGRNGPPPDLALHDVPFLGDLGDPRVDEALRHRHLPNGAIVVASSMEGSELNTVVHKLIGHDMHVHVVQGLTGIASQRIFPDPIVTDSAFYIAPEPPAGSKPVMKRVIDLVFGSIALLLLSPIMSVVALAVRFTSPGPILFRQERVGLHGETFTVLKFRTMVQDAEQQLEELADDNARGGPLFKVANDPRVTKVGNVLRKTSLDELPQLFNVLQGAMSLVGPRPALPSEVEQFDSELLERLEVKPGITGLWQVEARDETSFDLYRRYDLFYVRNWSVLLDLVILFRTALTVLLRPVLAKGGEAFNGRTAEGATVLD